MVAGQSKTHFWFLVSMAVVLAVISVAIVNRPLAQSYPIGLFVLAIFAVVGVHIFSSRFILDGNHLTLRRYGRKCWNIDVRDAVFSGYDDDAGWPAWRVWKGQRKIGTIQAILFDPRQLAPLIARLGLIIQLVLLESFAQSRLWVVRRSSCRPVRRASRSISMMTRLHLSPYRPDPRQVEA